MRLGRTLSLRVTRQTEHGVYLSDGEDEVLLPKSQVPPDARKGELLRVFVLTDSEDRPIATTKVPLAQAGQFARMRVVAVTDSGAFLDWGLDKDLFCPFREQRNRLQVDDEPIVYVYVDEESGRLAGSTRLERFLSNDRSAIKDHDAVEILVVDRTPERIGVIVDDRWKGAIFPDEWTEPLAIGERRKAFVKRVRPGDRKIAISLRPQGRGAILGERDRVLELLRETGSLPVSDQSSPEEIQRLLGMSKGAFKKLIGALYREGVIEIGEDSIRLRGGP